MDFVTYPDRDLLLMGLADRLGSELREALMTGADRVSLCVPGGTTPGPIFDILCGLDLDWSRVDVMLNDERWVDETSPRSNTAMLKQRLLVGRAAAARLVPLYADAPTPEAGLPALIDGVRAALPLGILVLGMGADMHTASLFPGADQLALSLSDTAPDLLAMRAAGAGEPRITLSAKALNTAIKKHILITGDEKKAAIEAAMTLPVMQAPIRAVLDNATVHWAP